MTNRDTINLTRELEDEFTRWMDRLPCYINPDVEAGVDQCIKNFSMSAKLIAQKHALKAKGKLNE